MSEDRPGATAATSVGALLERDHREIDDHFAAFAAGLADGRIEVADLDSGSSGLRHHIWVEEEFHFPPLRAAGLIGPILVMLREHGEIWDLLDLLDTQVTADGDRREIRATFGRLETILGEHNFKEERILYPSGDARLDAATATEIRAALTSGRRPAEWTCELAGRSA